MNPTTRALIFNSQNQLLTVKHHGSSFWSLPGGKIETGEDLQSALKREIFEELGVECEIKNLAFVHEFRYSPESDVTVEFFFWAKIPTENLEELQGEHGESELANLDWNTLDKNLDIKPGFLKDVDCTGLGNTEFVSYG